MLLESVPPEQSHEQMPPLTVHANTVPDFKSELAYIVQDIAESREEMLNMHASLFMHPSIGPGSSFHVAFLVPRRYQLILGDTRAAL
jgi:hypothetical protein